MIEMAVAIGLATWRVTSLFSRESGPFNVFQRFRELFGIQHNDNGDVIAWPDWAKVLICPLCLSVWFVAGMYGVWRIEPTAVWVIAAMGIAALVEEWRTH